MKNNVVEIIACDKCFKCGTCISVCPVKAIDTKYNNQKGFYDIEVDEIQCVFCGRCTDVCPAVNNNFNNYSDYIGPFLKLTLAYSANSHIRRMATSGGVVNSLIRFLLYNKYVDAAIVVTQKDDEPMNSQVVLINDPIVLEKNPRDFASRYVSLPVCKYLGMLEPNKKYVMVGTPCQIKGAKAYLSQLKLKNVILFGIACSGGTSFKATQLVAEKQNNQHAFLRVYYRGEGWPGLNSFYYSNGNMETVINKPHLRSLFNNMFTSQVFKNKACRHCQDHFSEQSDISFFDFWNKDEVTNERVGKSAVLCRTSLGLNVFNDAIANGIITLGNEISLSDCLNSQKWVLVLKKRRPLVNSISLDMYYRVIDFIWNYKLYNVLPSITYKMLTVIFLIILKRAGK